MTYYAKSLNLERTVRQAYDDLLATYDVLLMPTLPYVAPKLPEAELSPKGTTNITYYTLSCLFGCLRSDSSCIAVLLQGHAHWRSA